MRTRVRIHRRISFGEKREGHSLVELLIVMSVLSSLITISIGWIHQSMKLSKQMQSRASHQNNLSRLSRMFREDVRFAADASIQGNTLSLNSGNVLYEAKDSLIQRTEQISTRTKRTDVFEVAPGSLVKWLRSDMSNSITLQIQRSSNTPLTSRHPAPSTDQSSNGSVRPPRNTDTIPRNDLLLQVELNRYARFEVLP
ncbi:PulJ/GspJ family protein [Rhodopirellula halodulae]|uniref:PulJ/GspJ family protein n=1 Tax=Rhodopirellula halodulae TaxID=2894198 RepID=UPI001E43DD23|nr:hypothetical protein [Rhodopirellula sp. JC737]MCC9657089.1 hypothetical protein [Rhodopirellula sp. JC737]